jgi:PLP dependent protein
MTDNFTSVIRQRTQRVLDQIAAAAARVGRNPQEIRLIVVTKAQPLETVKAAVEAGITLLGENYTEEAVAKMQALPDPRLEWHMIGHVQSRKAELVAGHFSMLHSLDSLKLATRLERFCAEAGRSMPALLEFNVGAEESKSGLPAWDETIWPDLLPEVEQMLALPHLKIRGLMTMPPYFENPEMARLYFQRLRRLRDFLSRRFPTVDWSELSMGTSVDFPVAVEEGATIVRVGTAILGSRS